MTVNDCSWLRRNSCWYRECADAGESDWRDAQRGLLSSALTSHDRDTGDPPIKPANDAVKRPVAKIPDPCYLIVQRICAAEPDTALVLESSVLSAADRTVVVTDRKEIDSVTLDRHLRGIAKVTCGHRTLKDFGVALVELVLPTPVVNVLSSMQLKHVVVVHDVESSKIPWETICLGNWFPAASAGLSRRYGAEKLSADKWLKQRRLDDKLKLLLVVNPTLDLARAEAEGVRMREILANYPGATIHELRGRSATWSAVRDALRKGLYDVVHCASHALFDPHDRLRSGIVCHGGKVLSGADLAGIDRLPALAVFNACESGRVRHFRLPTNHGLAVGAAIQGPPVGLAEAFLREGIANYVGTNWPLSDTAAKVFAETFYPALLEGQPIGQALSLARRRVQAEKSVDWANYVHFGRYSFVLKQPLGPTTRIAAECVQSYAGMEPCFRGTCGLRGHDPETSGNRSRSSCLGFSNFCATLQGEIR